MSAVDKLLQDAGLSAREVYPAGVRVRFLVIGPKEAQALLIANKDNRRLRPGRVRFYVRVMKAGGWMLTHQGIAFNAEGIGIDLQHRLQAVIVSGVEITLMVTEGLSQEAFQAIDQHERRSMSDALRMERELTEEARMFWQLCGAEGSTMPTIEEVAELAGDIEDQHDHLKNACSTKRQGLSAVPVRCAAILLMMERPQSSGDVAQAYRDLVLANTEVWTKPMHSFAQQVMTGKAKAGGTWPSRQDLFCRALVALDPSKLPVSKIQINEETSSIARKRARTVLGFKAPNGARS